MRVLLFGDSVALTLGVGLSYTSDQDKYGYVLSDKGILGCGVVDGPEVELMGARDTRRPACDGSPLVHRRAARRASPGLPMADRHDRGQAERGRAPGRALGGGRPRVPGTWTNILSPTYAAYVKSTAQKAARTLVTRPGPAWCSSPPPAPTRANSPTATPGRRTTRRAWPSTTSWCGRWRPSTRGPTRWSTSTQAACPGGKYASTVDGVVIRRSDGVHFTNAGWRVPRAEDHAADRGGRPGADAARHDVDHLGLSRRVRPAPGSRSGAVVVPLLPLFARGLRVDVRVGIGHDALRPQRGDAGVPRRRRRSRRWSSSASSTSRRRSWPGRPGGGRPAAPDRPPSGAAPTPPPEVAGARHRW